MSETLTQPSATDIPGYPMERAAACPFAPPPQMLDMNKAKGLSRVRIWTAARRGSSPATRRPGRCSPTPG